MDLSVGKFRFLNFIVTPGIGLRFAMYPPGTSALKKNDPKKPKPLGPPFASVEVFMACGDLYPSANTSGLLNVFDKVVLSNLNTNELYPTTPVQSQSSIFSLSFGPAFTPLPRGPAAIPGATFCRLDKPS